MAFLQGDKSPSIQNCSKEAVKPPFWAWITRFRLSKHGFTGSVFDSLVFRVIIWVHCFYIRHEYLHDGIG